MMMSPSSSPHEGWVSLPGLPPLESVSGGRLVAVAWQFVSSFAISCGVVTTAPRAGRGSARSAGNAVLVDGRALCMMRLQDAGTQ